MKRGFYGIGVYHPKTEINIGTLWRSAMNLGASFIFTVGKRYKKQASDTVRAYRHCPLFHYETFEDLRDHLPFDAQLIAVEQVDFVKPTELSAYVHPERAVYLLGAEDSGIPEDMVAKCFDVVAIDSPLCLNVAVAGSIVMYDRQAKSKKM